MNTYIFLYPETSFFEVTLVAYFMKTVGNVYILTEEHNQIIPTNEGIQIMSDVSFSEIEIHKTDSLIICGGNTDNIIEPSSLQNVIQQFKANECVIGGICAGAEIVKDALNIADTTNTTTIINHNIVLSPGNEYVDFALAVGKANNIFTDTDDYNETVNYFKYFQPVE